MLSLNKGQSIQSQGAKLLKMFKVTRKSHKVHRLCCIFESSEEAFKNPPTQPWPLWFSGLCVGLQTKSGLMPGLWARSPVQGVQEATTHWYFSPSLSPFPSLFKKKIPTPRPHCRPIKLVSLGVDPSVSIFLYSSFGWFQCTAKPEEQTHWMCLFLSVSTDVSHSSVWVTKENIFTNTHSMTPFTKTSEGMFLHLQLRLLTIS